MSGKLIQNLKRKREGESSKPLSLSTNANTIAGTSSDEGNNNNGKNDASTSSYALSTHNSNDINSLEEQNQQQCNVKRTKLSTSTENSFLIIALQKIIELENDLNEINNEFKINGLYGDDYDGEIDEEVSRINGLAKTAGSYYEAEALGFAMCARETLLFLQNEGVPENSLLYKALKDRLVGKSDGIPI